MAKRTLIIEDDHAYRMFLSKLLHKVKIISDYAEDGIEGLQKIKQKKYDFIILDLMMPRIDGHHVLQVMKKLGNFTPVIVVSAKLDRDTLLRLAKLGVCGFISKPMNVADFYQAVNKVCPIEAPAG